VSSGEFSIDIVDAARFLPTPLGAVRRLERAITAKSRHVNALFRASMTVIPHVPARLGGVASLFQ
jgi:hypothetical protein